MLRLLWKGNGASLETAQDVWAFKKVEKGSSMQGRRSCWGLPGMMNAKAGACDSGIASEQYTVAILLAGAPDTKVSGISYSTQLSSQQCALPLFVVVWKLSDSAASSSEDLLMACLSPLASGRKGEASWVTATGEGSCICSCIPLTVIALHFPAVM